MRCKYLSIEKCHLYQLCLPSHVPMTLFKSANTLPIQVSDALLKLQKVPEGTAPRAGYLADLSKFFEPRASSSKSRIHIGGPEYRYPDPREREEPH